MSFPFCHKTYSDRLFSDHTCSGIFHAVAFDNQLTILDILACCVSRNNISVVSNDHLILFAIQVNDSVTGRSVTYACTILMEICTIAIDSATGTLCEFQAIIGARTGAKEVGFLFSFGVGYGLRVKSTYKVHITGGNHQVPFVRVGKFDVINQKNAAIKEGEEVIGNRTRVKVVKNKVAAPFTQCEFDILYGCGISREASILDLATELDIIQKSGSWFSYNNERIGQGRENTRLFLKDNPELCAEIEQKIRESMKDVELFKLGENDAVEADDSVGAEVEG